MNNQQIKAIRQFTFLLYKANKATKSALRMGNKILKEEGVAK